MIVIGIDPGHEQSALVGYDTETRQIRDAKFGDNDKMEDFVCSPRGRDYHVLAIEMVGCYGLAVGREVFETCVQIGRFECLWSKPKDRILRQTIKAHLCNSTKANDSNIRRALMDRWGGDLSVKKGGPLAGIKTHLWAALAVAVAWAELRGKQHELGDAA